jgi:hypothetical protein
MSKEIVRPHVRTSIYWYIDALVEYLESSASPPRDAPIITLDMAIQSQPCILYNTEQLTRGSELQRLLIRAKKPDVAAVWDYSTANIDILRKYGVTAEHHPVGISPVHRQRLQQFLMEPKEYDVGFSGTMSPRRRLILQELVTKGLSVLQICDKIGDPRDSELAKCRVIINIHFNDDYQVFESVRCAQWLDVGVPVVSEKSLDDDPRAINVSYGELVTATLLATEKARNLVHVLHEGAE